MKNDQVEDAIVEHRIKIATLKAKYKDDPPYTIEQCIKEVFSTLDQDSIFAIKDAVHPRQLMTILGGNFGMEIRNRYSLWYRPLERNLNADDFSYEVVYNVWVLLKQGIETLPD